MAGSRKSRSTDLFDQYVDGPPSPQNAVDAIPGWTCALPPSVGATAGSLPLYADDRIAWMLEQYGPLTDKRVLELGPLEGSHTFMIEQAGAAEIDAIEANKLAFLRCLVFKELIRLQRAHFHLGNFIDWLEQPGLSYDLIVASGVLYHLRDPLRFLERAATVSDSLFLWTHYSSEEAMPPSDPRRSVFREGVEHEHFHGVDVRLYPRSYHHAEQNASFCGGLYDDHRWLERDDLLAALKAVGYNSIEVAHDDPGHPNGPSFSVLARRLQAAPQEPEPT
ncbi:MAG: hypothetical protein JWQ36_2220 [Enterovirga sp.]|jgi:hypothetical protein|nr:hypothetical protein [Enterovirga sp.]